MPPFTDFKLLHPFIAPSPIEVRLSGNVMLSKPVHSLNAKSPIETSVFGKLILFKFEHLLNACSPKTRILPRFTYLSFGPPICSTFNTSSGKVMLSISFEPPKAFKYGFPLGTVIFLSFGQDEKLLDSIFASCGKLTVVRLSSLLQLIYSTLSGISRVVMLQ